MSKVICIPCLNMSNYEFIIHRHSVAKCSLCGNKSERLRQMLLVSIIGIKECRQEDGCEYVLGFTIPQKHKLVKELK